MLAAHAPECRVVPQQIGQLGPLLDQIALGEPGDFFLKVVDAHDLAENEAGVVEAKGFIKVAGDQIFGDGGRWFEKIHDFQ